MASASLGPPRCLLGTAHGAVQQIIEVLDSHFGASEDSRLRARVVQRWQPEGTGLAVTVHDVNAPRPEGRIPGRSTFDPTYGVLFAIPPDPAANQQPLRQQWIPTLL